MNYDPQKHHRHSIRLTGFGYSQSGFYFITICSHNHNCLFGKIENGQMRLNKFGEIVHFEWYRSADIRHEIDFDEFGIMPNHVHGIVIITNGNIAVGAHGRAPQHDAPQHDAPLRRKPKSLGSFVAGFKCTVTKQINEIRQTPGIPVWQRNYYDHIIRNENELNRIRKYIIENPLKWGKDRFYK